MIAVIYGSMRENNVGAVSGDVLLIRELPIRSPATLAGLTIYIARLPPGGDISYGRRPFRRAVLRAGRSTGM